MEFLILIAIAVAAIIGVVVCAAIRVIKTENAALCQPGTDCTGILTSRYSTFLGIPLETAGVIYYIVVCLTGIAGALYLKLGTVTPAEFDTGVFLLLGITGAGFAMSCYLTFVQAAYLRAWCFWCLKSALISTIIFLLSILLVFVSKADVIPVMVNFHELIYILHVVAFGISILCVTMSDIIVFRFLHTFAMGQTVEKVFRFTSQTLWVGLFLVILSALGLHLPDIVILKEAPGVVVQTIFIAVIVVNASFLHLVVSPYLYDTVEKRTLCIWKVRVLRKVAFGLGAISFITWYAAFALALYPELDAQIGTMLGGYIAITLIGILISQVVESASCKV